MNGRPLRVVALQVGDAYPDSYVDRLGHMVERHLPRPHEFVVFSDRPRSFRTDIVVRDCSSWGLKGYFNKLRLFDPSVTGHDPFIYLDITLVVRDDLGRLLTEADKVDASLIGVDDWNYPVLNSSVLLVRPDEQTRRVWEDFRSGRRYQGSTHGDQEYIHQVFLANSPDRLRYWPSELVASYKGLRKMAVADPGRAREMYERCVILKFHGHPRPHEVLAPWRSPVSTILRHPFRPRLWRFLGEEIEANWR